MNGYDLSRNWFNYKFNNPNKLRPNHTELYFYIVDLWNRLGQKSKIGLPTIITMQTLGMNNRGTYYKLLDDLEKCGFIKTVEKSQNQYISRVIAITKSAQANKQPLDLANIQADEQAASQPLIHIDEQVTSNKEQRTILFDSFWLLYGKKVGKEKCFAKFLKLSNKDVEAIIDAVPLYVKLTPDKKFRKDPFTWLNGKHWQDELTPSSQTLFPDDIKNRKPQPSDFYLPTEYDEELKKWEAKQ